MLAKDLPQHKVILGFYQEGYLQVLTLGFALGSNYLMESDWSETSRIYLRELPSGKTITTGSGEDYLSLAYACFLL
ncbi:MAG: hypothetical protein RMK19_06115 [Bacteroidia bacterium]|nr:hypothetical protein [Bacteroidia bacterium]MDW8015568.1 hypothetical protein [Bacteroidia bacterium]